MTDPIATIRAALDNWYPDHIEDKAAAYSALSEIEGRVLPEMPEDYGYLSISDLGNGTFEGHISGHMYEPSPYAIGPTPRAAVLAAIEKREATK